MASAGTMACWKFVEVAFRQMQAAWKVGGACCDPHLHCGCCNCCPRHASSPWCVLGEKGCTTCAFQLSGWLGWH